jgi:hypothetical protein
MTIDMSKKYRTRDGRKVRIYAVDAGGDYPVHGSVLRAGSDGDWFPERWDESGYFITPRTDHPSLDLVEAKAEVWVCVFEDGGRNFTAYDTKEDCEKWGGASMTNGKAVRFVQEDEA